MKIFCFLLLFTIHYSLFTFPSFAQNSRAIIPPIRTPFSRRAPAPAGIINPSNPGYNANDIHIGDTVKCTRPYTITNDFPPREIENTIQVPNGDGTFREEVEITYERYPVTKVEANDSLNLPFSNLYNRQLTFYTANNVDMCASVEEANRALRDYNLSGLNMAVRNTHLQQQKCLKGQRMVKAALSLSTLSAYLNNSTNEHVLAYTTGSGCSSKITSGEPIFFSQVLNSLKNERWFFSPTQECNETSVLTTLSAAINAAAGNPTFANDVLDILASKGTTTHARTIYRNLNVTDTGSSEQEVAFHNINALSQEEIVRKSISIPLAAVYNPNTKFVTNTHVGYKQKLVTRDVCANVADNEIYDEKSPVTFLAFVRNLINDGIEVFNQVVTVSRTISVDHIAPRDIQDNVDTARTQMLNLMPIADQKGFDQLQQNSTSDHVSAGYGYDNQTIFRQYTKNFYTLEQQRNLGLL